VHCFFAQSAYKADRSGIILDIVAFPENATYGSVPPDIIWNLGFFVGPATSIFTLVGIALFFLYGINRERYQSIVRELGERRAADELAQSGPGD
jgi:Na+/melibiose symporter-like transporter